jgi:hypothetical protein
MVKTKLARSSSLSMASLSSPARLKNVNNFCIDHLVSSLQFDVKGVTFFLRLMGETVGCPLFFLYLYFHPGGGLSSHAIK